MLLLRLFRLAGVFAVGALGATAVPGAFASVAGLGAGEGVLAGVAVGRGGDVEEGVVEGTPPVFADAVADDLEAFLWRVDDLEDVGVLGVDEMGAELLHPV